MRKVLLELHDYNYFPYELDFAEREVKALFNLRECSVKDKFITIKTDTEYIDSDFLTYIKSVHENGVENKTLQYRLEKSCSISGLSKRQSTKYLVHGLHDYKGKFNPQIVKGILNQFGADSSSKIFDPFCGSGTTLIEGAIRGCHVQGIDVNPLAVFITNAKYLSINHSYSLHERTYHKIIESHHISKSGLVSDDYTEFLSGWFDQSILLQIESLRNTILKVGGKLSNVFLVILSDLLRDYSLQEPADLRVRRRKSPMPELPFLDAFEKRARRYLETLKESKKVLSSVKYKQSQVAEVNDSRNINFNKMLNGFKEQFDFAITSPPYATALPYADTQRLSLVFLRLAKKSEVKLLEGFMTGSRETYGSKKAIIIDSYKKNKRILPEELYNYCLMLSNNLGESDGFRRQMVPSLMYRYLCDMRDMFNSVSRVLKRGGKFGLVVGHNRTTLGGTKIEINTPELLANLSLHCGWKIEESIKLQTYHRYSIHSKNAVNLETLIVLVRI